MKSLEYTAGIALLVQTSFAVSFQTQGASAFLEVRQDVQQQEPSLRSLRIHSALCVKKGIQKMGCTHTRRNQNLFITSMADACHTDEGISRIAPAIVAFG